MAIVKKNNNEQDDNIFSTESTVRAKSKGYVYYDFGPYYLNIFKLIAVFILMGIVFKGGIILFYPPFLIWFIYKKMRVNTFILRYKLGKEILVYKDLPKDKNEIITPPMSKELLITEIESTQIEERGDNRINLNVISKGQNHTIIFEKDELFDCIEIYQLILAFQEKEIHYDAIKHKKRIERFSNRIKSGDYSWNVKEIPDDEYIRYIHRIFVPSLHFGGLGYKFFSFLIGIPFIFSPLFLIALAFVYWRIRILRPKNAFWKVIITNKSLYIANYEKSSSRNYFKHLIGVLMRAHVKDPKASNYFCIPLYYIAQSSTDKVVTDKYLKITTEENEDFCFSIGGTYKLLNDEINDILSHKDKFEQSKLEYAHTLSDFFLDREYHKYIGDFINDTAFANLVYYKKAVSVEDATTMFFDIKALADFAQLQSDNIDDTLREELFISAFPMTRSLLKIMGEKHNLFVNKWGIFNIDQIETFFSLFGKPVYVNGKKKGKIVNILFTKDGMFDFYVVDDKYELILDAILKFDIITDFIIKKLRKEFIVSPDMIQSIEDDKIVVNQINTLDNGKNKWSYLGPTYLEHYIVVPEFLKKYLRKNRMITRSIMTMPNISVYYLHERILAFESFFKGIITDIYLDLANKKIVALEIKNEEQKYETIPFGINLEKPHIYIGQGMGLEYEPVR